MQGSARHSMGRLYRQLTRINFINSCVSLGTVHRPLHLPCLYPTWTPKVCRIMAFMAVLTGLGPLFYILLGFRYIGPYTPVSRVREGSWYTSAGQSKERVAEARTSMHLPEVGFRDLGIRV